MESEKKQRCQTALYEEEVLVRRTGFADSQGYSGMEQEKSLNPKDQIQDTQTAAVLKQLRDKRLLVVNPRRRNGIILYKRYHAEFAGPGSAVGGLFDWDCEQVLLVGNFSQIYPESVEDKQRAYALRRQWIRLTKQITDNPVPIQRAQMILNQFEHYFDPETIAKLPDEAFALLVGVLPHTIAKVRNTADRVDVSVSN
jgi:hypothetical protein